MHSNTDQHIPSQNMLKFYVYIAVRYVTCCKPCKSTQDDRSTQLAYLKLTMLRAGNYFATFIPTTVKNKNVYFRMIFLFHVPHYNSHFQECGKKKLKTRFLSINNST